MPSVQGTTPEPGDIPRTEGVPPSIGLQEESFHQEIGNVFHGSLLVLCVRAGD